MEYLKASFDEIAEDAIARGEEATNYLMGLVDTKTLDADGKEKGLSFLTIKKEYFKKYLPEMIPAKKQKPLSMKEKLALKLKK